MKPLRTVYFLSPGYPVERSRAALLRAARVRVAKIYGQVYRVSHRVAMAEMRWFLADGFPGSPPPADDERAFLLAMGALNREEANLIRVQKNDVKRAGAHGALRRIK